MKGADNVQRQFDAQVEQNITNSIKDTIDPPKTDEDSGDQPAGESPKTPEQPKKSKNEVDNPPKKTDTKKEGSTDDDGQQMYDAVVSKVITDEFGGDASKRKEAEAIANLAIKTFAGDPLKAAKSYKNLFDQTHQLKSLRKQNPIIDKLLVEAEQGMSIDENYLKSLLGTATSDADQPAKTPQAIQEEQLDDDFDPDKLTPETLIEAGILNKQHYDNLTGIDKRDALEKARIRYAYKVLPDRIAERSAKLTLKKQQDMTEKEKLETAKKTNKTRLDQDYLNVVSKYDIDFEGNPEHAKLWDEIHNKAWRFPDLDDDSGLLVDDNAVEKATKHVFAKHGIPLQGVQVVEDKPEKGSEHKVDRMASGSHEAMKRILAETDGFKGIATKRRQQERPNQQGETLNDRVNDRVSQEVSRGLSTSRMISGVRKMDRSRTG